MNHKFPDKVPLNRVSLQSDVEVKIRDIVECHQALVKKNPALSSIFGTFLDAIEASEF